MKVAIVTGLCIELDAISDSVVAQRSVLVDAGHEVMVFAQGGGALPAGAIVETADPWWMGAHPDYAGADLVIFHHGIHYDLFNALQLRHDHAVVVVHFHNITPPALLSGAAARAASEGLDQLAAAAMANLAWCDSQHNADVLAMHAAVGLADTRVVPLLVGGVDGPGLGGASPRSGVLSVGRLVRAKCHADVIRAYASLGEQVRARNPLTIIGRRTESEPGHPSELLSLGESVGIADQLRLLVDVPAKARDGAYAENAVFVIASHHEGFCVPVIEALAGGCQVVATDAGALPDTVAGLGAVVPVGDLDALSGAMEGALAGAGDPDAGAVEAYVRTFGQDAFRKRVLLEATNAVHRGRGRNMAELEHDRSRFAPKQKRLLEMLACPACSGGLAVQGELQVDGAVAAADLVCAVHGRVGVIEDFRPGFLPRNLEAGDPVVGGELEQAVDLDADAVWNGAWSPVPEGRRAEGTGDDWFAFECGAGGFEITFLGHEWSGTALVEVEGGEQHEVDLYRSPPEPVQVGISGLGDGTHRACVTALGGSSGPSQGAQVVVRSARRAVPIAQLRPPGVGAVNRGNPYPGRFPQLVAEMPVDGVALDCGGGDRRYGDDRVYNLEYMDYELPDLYGDGLALPFADDSFDLVQSQAVLEHVPDPQRAVDEIVRILKPGGLAYFEVAFMQPLHAVPSHYMNVTPHGIEHLCRDLEVVDKGEFGGLAETIGWIGGLVDAESRLGPGRFAEVISALDDLDRSLSADELRMAASAVYLLGRKP
ncbi:MAG: glycosyltransferase [Actinomycetia bacterium]|nr:glycosyltransferase [Actinomycetes bacterium]